MNGEPVHPDLESVVRALPTILVFIPNTNELQRFVLAGAFAALGRDRRLHYVLPQADAATMCSATPLLTTANSSVVDVPAERLRLWTEVFRAGTEHYARLSPSFAIRAGLDVDPGWKELSNMPAPERAAMDAAFDETVATRLRGLSPLPAIVDLIHRFQPVCCIVPTSLLDVFCNEVTWACEAEHVACLLLQSGWDNLSSKGLVYGRTPFIGCWGPQSAGHALSIQRLSRKRLALLGAPHYELLQPAGPEAVRRLRAELGVAEGGKLVLFGGSFRQFDETTTLLELERAIAGGRLPSMTVVYRPHPWRASRGFEDSFFDHQWSHVVFDPEMRARYLREQAEPGYIKRQAPMFDMVYLSALLSAADAVMSPMSTLLIESLILEKPTMAIAFSDGKHRYTPDVTAQTTHMAALRGCSALLWCDDPSRLVRDCARLLKPRWDDKHERARRRLLDEVVTREPGTYAERLAEFCRSRVEPSGRKWRGQRTGVKRDTISHSYGAHLVARRYCGVREGEPLIAGYWMHGWLPAYHNLHPLLVALHKTERGAHGIKDADLSVYEAQIDADRAQVPQWVSRPDQAEFLQSCGYRQVRAIGLPIAYLPDPQVRRVPRSLLVIPPHGHRTHGPDDPLAEAYADAIAALRGRFAHVWVGLNEDDLTANQWVESFRRRNIGVFVTTDQGDPEALATLQRVLSTFEYVTSNGFGSHLAFAAFCGARVSLYGPYAEFPAERMRTTFAVKLYPELLDTACRLVGEAAMREHYPFLFVPPDEAAEQREWGAREVGAPWRVSPEEMRRLFGWDLAVPA